MALNFDRSKVAYSFDRNSVSFYAEDGGKRVPCFVSQEALMDRARVRDASADELIALHRQHAASIEAIAEGKYEARQIESDGSIIVKTADLDRRTL